MDDNEFDVWEYNKWKDEKESIKNPIKIIEIDMFEGNRNRVIH